jgi:hypothetical protein
MPLNEPKIAADYARQHRINQGAPALVRASRARIASRARVFEFSFRGDRIALFAPFVEKVAKFPTRTARRWDDDGKFIATNTRRRRVRRLMKISLVDHVDQAQTGETIINSVT